MISCNNNKLPKLA